MRALSANHITGWIGPLLWDSKSLATLRGWLASKVRHHPVAMITNKWCILILGCSALYAPSWVSAQSATADLPDAPSYVAFPGGSNLPGVQDEDRASDPNVQDNSEQLSSSEHHGGTPATQRQVDWHSLPKDFLHD